MQQALSRVERLRRIEQLLYRASEGVRAAEIAERLGTSQRTVYRDLEQLSERGVPLWQEDGRFGVLRDQHLATIRLSFNEAMTCILNKRKCSQQSSNHLQKIPLSTALAMDWDDSSALLCCPFYHGHLFLMITVQSTC